jgi:tRNA(Arg) A34 adenosine deaminase TadA
VRQGTRLLVQLGLRGAGVESTRVLAERGRLTGVDISQLRATVELQMRPRRDDERHLVTAIDLARRSREKGNHPFGSLLVDSEGEVVLEAENTAVAGGDLLGHAELNLVRVACSQFGRDFLQGCTLYTSTEPCAMCAGAIYWSGIGRVVYALSSETLEAIVNDEEGESRLALRCRRVFASGGRSVQVEGPMLEDRAREVHQNFW